MTRRTIGAAMLGLLGLMAPPFAEAKQQPRIRDAEGNVVRIGTEAMARRHVYGRSFWCDNKVTPFYTCEIFRRDYSYYRRAEGGLSAPVVLEGRYAIRGPVITVRTRARTFRYTVASNDRGDIFYLRDRQRTPVLLVKAPRARPRG